MEIEDFPFDILEKVRYTWETCHQDISTIHHSDQDEDIKVSTYNSDEENTSSEEEEIDIQNPWILNQQIFMGKEK
ncbi:hypothetical protein Gotur_034112 [Gossypium turneri]